MRNKMFSEDLDLVSPSDLIVEGWDTKFDLGIKNAIIDIEDSEEIVEFINVKPSPGRDLPSK